MRRKYDVRGYKKPNEDLQKTYLPTSTEDRFEYMYVFNIGYIILQGKYLYPYKISKGLHDKSSLYRRAIFYSL